MIMCLELSFRECVWGIGLRIVKAVRISARNAYGYRLCIAVDHRRTEFMMLAISSTAPLISKIILLIAFGDAVAA